MPPTRRIRALRGIRVAPVIALAIGGAPSAVMACEPILPLARAFGGAAWLSESLWWLGAAIAIKCIVFVRLERRLTWKQAAGFLILGNVLSTVVGALVAGAAANVGIFLIGLPLVYVLSIAPAGRLIEATGPAPGKPLSPLLLAAAAPILLVFTWVLFGLAHAWLPPESAPVYWLAKIAYLIVALLVSLGLTSLWEEWVVARMARWVGRPGSFVVPVFRANYVALAVVALAAAVRMLPDRLHSPGFLSALSSMVLGLG